MASHVERRRFRSDVELRRHRDEVKAQWDARQHQNERDHAAERAARVDELVERWRHADAASPIGPKKKRA